VTTERKILPTVLAAVAAVALGQGVVSGGSGGANGLPITPTSVSTGPITATGYLYAADAGLNNLTLTGNLSDNAVRGQNVNMVTSDAGFSGLYAVLGNFGGTAGAGGVVVGISGGLPGLWMGTSPATISTSNYRLLTAGTDTILNENGGGFSFRSSNTQKASIDTGGSFTLADAGLNSLKAAMFTLSDTRMAGSITLSGGTGTATVYSGAKCVCSEVSNGTAGKCSVSSTTLTATYGAGSDVINYLCWVP
jgi:hypothetical protein